jgi:hypothetical protein
LELAGADVPIAADASIPLVAAGWDASAASSCGVLRRLSSLRLPLRAGTGGAAGAGVGAGLTLFVALADVPEFVDDVAVLLAEVPENLNLLFQRIFHSFQKIDLYSFMETERE